MNSQKENHQWKENCLKPDLAREVEESACKQRINIEKSILHPILKSMSADRNSAYVNSKVTSLVTADKHGKVKELGHTQNWKSMLSLLSSF